MARKILQCEDFESYLELRNLYYFYRDTLNMFDGNRIGFVYDKKGCKVIDTNNTEDLILNSLDNFVKYIGENCKDQNAEPLVRK